MWSDNETDIDLLGFQVHSDLVRTVITNPDLLPITIGVFADWGGGKTSLMKMLQRDLEPDTWEDSPKDKEACEKVACLYFNSWLFEGYDDAKSAILSSILLSLGEHKKFGPKVRDKVVTLLKSVNYMRIARLGMKHVAAPAIAAYVSGGATVLPGLIGSAGALLGLAAPETLEKEPVEEGAEKGESINWEELIRKNDVSSGPLDVRGFRDSFKSMLQDSDIESLVILIDDLDRCSPERIVDSLEAIKLFLNVDQTAFVIGADPRIVRHAVEWRYGKYGASETTDEKERLITDYLEKLIQVPYQLPCLSPAETETYMSLLFCQQLLSTDDYLKCVGACQKQRSENRYAVFGHAAIQNVLGEPPVSLQNALAFSSSAAPLITEGLKGNPRQVKRFLNAHHLRKELAKVAKLTHIQDDILIKLMLLEYAEPGKFAQLFEWQAMEDGFPRKIKEFEEAVRKKGNEADPEKEIKEIDASWGSNRMFKWLSMEPFLSDVDLRDYYWIARDKLNATLSNVSMIPPVVRQALEDLLSASKAENAAAIKMIKEFSPEEKSAILHLVQEHIIRHLGQRRGYDSLLSLSDIGFADAINVLVDILLSQPLDSVPAPIGAAMATLYKKGENKVLLAALEDHVKDSKTKFAKAFLRLIH